MKIGLECIECLIHRAYIETRKATDEDELQKKVLIRVSKQLIEELNKDSVPSHLGTIRDRIIKEETKNPDPFKKDKIISNNKALEILPTIKKFISSQRNQSSRFRKACLASIVGNTIELGVLGHEFKYEDIESEIIKAEVDLAIDDIADIEKMIKNATNVLFLTDNAGEIVLDRLLISEIKYYGPKVTVAVKGAPISNDATLDDAKIAGIDKVADNIITTGADSIGFIPKHCSKKFLDVFYSSDFVVAKGMAHLETLTEYKPEPPRAILLRTKCKPVADYLKVDLNRNIAKLFK
jgi:uncharacterized protein with ATP-grasp and redox domains